MNTFSLNTKDDSLACGICSLPLSVFPVYHSPAMGNVCGRCERKYRKTSQIQTIYEKIAKKLIFPCSFHKLGCTVELTWNLVSTHETSCRFRIKCITCPLQRQCCIWVGEPSKLSYHIRERHEQFFHNPIQVILTKDFENKIFFSEFNGSTMVIKCIYQENLNGYQCCIINTTNFNMCQNYNYDITIHPYGHSGNQVLFQCGKIEYILRNITFSPKNGLVIPIISINHLFENSSELILKFTIVEKTQIEIQNTNNMSDKMHQDAPLLTTKLSMKILQELECPVCADMMAPPIYICSKGHNVCSKCKLKLEECPICRARFSDGRNFTLEKFSAFIAAPCTYRMNGCSFAATISRIKQHELKCSFAIRTCIFSNCQWNGSLLGLLEHLEEYHAYLECNTIYTYELRKKFQQYMILGDEDVFFLSIDFQRNKPFRYSLHCIGTDIPKCEYEMEIIEPFAENRLVFRDICQPANNSFEKESLLFYSIPSDMMCSIVKNNNILNFRVQFHYM